MTRILGPLALVLLGVVAALGVAEVALRLLPLTTSHDVRELHELRPDRPWLYGMRPGAAIRGPGGVHYAVNADGFRDRAYARPKPPETFRVVVLGHSIAFGWGVAVEDTYPKVLEARLGERATGKRVEVLNLGVSGYNAYTEGALFADVGVTYQPDVVLVEFGINDLNDPTLHFDAQTTRRLGAIPDAAFPNPPLRRPLPPLPPLGTRLCRLSRLCSLVAARADPLPEAALLQAALAPHDDPSERELAWLHARYDDIARTAAGIGARFAVVVFPYALQLDGRAPDHVQERLSELGRAASWPTVDLLPAFRAAGRTGTPLFVDLWHPTAAGHRAAAETILHSLACDGLLPVPAPERCDGPERAARTDQPMWNGDSMAWMWKSTSSAFSRASR